MICKILRRIGIRIFSEAELIQGIKDLQEQEAQPQQPAAVLKPLHGTGGSFVSVRTSEIVRGSK